LSGRIRYGGFLDETEFWGRLEHRICDELLTVPTVIAKEEIDWAALLPEDWLTGWLTPDPQKRP
jgi:hypothetical protein